MTDQYHKCLAESREKGRRLCQRGYCTAKSKFEVYPSAYANGYATSVCLGRQPDFEGKLQVDQPYWTYWKAKHGQGATGLRRWFDEVWVNVCESGDGPGGYALCGSGQGVQHPERYPYCRPYYRQPETTLVTAPQLTPSEIDHMCQWKRSLPQGVHGKPTYIRLPEEIRKRGANTTSKAKPGIEGDDKIKSNGNGKDMSKRREKSKSKTK